MTELVRIRWDCLICSLSAFQGLSEKMAELLVDKNGLSTSFDLCPIQKSVFFLCFLHNHTSVCISVYHFLVFIWKKKYHPLDRYQHDSQSMHALGGGHNSGGSGGNGVLKLEINGGNGVLWSLMTYIFFEMGMGKFATSTQDVQIYRIYIFLNGFLKS